MKTGNPSRPQARAASRSGFTLIEAALATVIVGTAVLAIMQLLVVCTQTNRAGADMTTAMYLAGNVQEAMADLPFNDPSGAGFGREEANNILAWDDIDDFHLYDSSAADPALPVDSQRQPVADLGRFAQLVTVTEVNMNNLSIAAAGSDAKRITVRIIYRAEAGQPQVELYRTSWVRVRS